MKPILLVGGGGHCLACIDVIESEGIFSIQGIVERYEAGRETVLNYPVLGSDSDLSCLLKSIPSALVSVGQLKSPSARENLHNLLVKLKANLPCVISPMSYVSPHASIGAGTIIMHGAIVSALASIGRNCIINSQALIEHEVVIGSHCHISTGVRVNGGAQVGSGTFIGSGAILHEGVRIGNNCVVGAGAVVRRDLSDATTFRCKS